MDKSNSSANLTSSEPPELRAVECPQCHVHFMTPELAERLQFTALHALQARLEQKDKAYDDLLRHNQENATALEEANKSANRWFHECMMIASNTEAAKSALEQERKAREEQLLALQSANSGNVLLQQELAAAESRLASVEDETIDRCAIAGGRKAASMHLSDGQAVADAIRALPRTAAQGQTTLGQFDQQEVNRRCNELRIEGMEAAAKICEYNRKYTYETGDFPMSTAHGLDVDAIRAEIDRMQGKKTT